MQSKEISPTVNDKTTTRDMISSLTSKTMHFKIVLTMTHGNMQLALHIPPYPYPWMQRAREPSVLWWTFAFNYKA